MKCFENNEVKDHFSSRRRFSGTFARSKCATKMAGLKNFCFFLFFGNFVEILDTIRKVSVKCQGDSGYDLDACKLPQKDEREYANGFASKHATPAP